MSAEASIAVVRVRYAETDKMGFVYHANYLEWFEVGRCEWLRARGWSYREMEEAGTQLPVIEAHCEYRRPARYDEEIEVRTRCESLSPVRLKFAYELVRRIDGVVAAAGYTVHASTDLSGRPRRLPDRVKGLLA
jgi:acyl-CoA thioester hydrolase